MNALFPTEVAILEISAVQRAKIERETRAVLAGTQRRVVRERARRLRTEFFALRRAINRNPWTYCQRIFVDDFGEALTGDEMLDLIREDWSEAIWEMNSLRTA